MNDNFLQTKCVFKENIFFSQYGLQTFLQAICCISRDDAMKMLRLLQLENENENENASAVRLNSLGERPRKAIDEEPIRLCM